jgi:hypothetical protein
MDNMGLELIVTFPCPLCGKPHPLNSFKTCANYFGRDTNCAWIHPSVQLCIHPSPSPKMIGLEPVGHSGCLSAAKSHLKGVDVTPSASAPTRIAHRRKRTGRYAHLRDLSVIFAVKDPTASGASIRVSHLFWRGGLARCSPCSAGTSCMLTGQGYAVARRRRQAPATGLNESLRTSESRFCRLAFGGLYFAQPACPPNLFCFLFMPR